MKDRPAALVRYSELSNSAWPETWACHTGIGRAASLRIADPIRIEPRVQIRRSRTLIALRTMDLAMARKVNMAEGK
jgi:hypothetical protein